MFLFLRIPTSSLRALFSVKDEGGRRKDELLPALRFRLRIFAYNTHCKDEG